MYTRSHEYREQNDWFGHFLEDCCTIGKDLHENSADLYHAYRSYCIETNEFVRSTADFYFAMENAGFERKTIDRKRYFTGLRLCRDEKSEFPFLA